MDNLKLESLEQINHDLQRKLSVKQIMENELKHEVDMLEDQLKKERTIQEEKDAEIKSLKAQISKLEHIIEDEKAKFESYKENIVSETEVPNASKASDTENSVVKQLEEALENQKVEIENIMLSSQTYKERSNKVQNENLLLNRKLKHLESQLEEKEKIIEFKTETLNEIKEDRENLKEKNILMESELMTLKTRPSDVNTKGNSLFAEVEDNRKLLVVKLRDMQMKYATIKKTLMSKNLEVSRLKEQHVLIYREWNDIKEEKLKNYSRLESAHLARIEELERELKNSEQDPKLAQLVSGDDGQLKWVDELVDVKRKEIESLRKELQARSLKEWTLQRTVHQLKSEVLTMKQKLLEQLVMKNDESEAVRKDLAINSIENKENCVLKEIVQTKSIKFCKEES